MAAPDPFLTVRSYATTLLAAAVDRYGLAVTEWSPETLEMELEQDLRQPVPADNLAKLFVAVNLLVSDAFFRSPTDFCFGCATLSGHPPVDGQLIIPDADDIAWAVTEAMLIAAPDDDNPFSADVVGLMGAVLDEESILVPPDVLRIAVRSADLAERVRYEYSDDPVMFNAVFDRDRARTDDINNLVAARTRGLLRQLTQIPFTSADAARVKQLAARLAAGLPPADPVDLVPD